MKEIKLTQGQVALVDDEEEWHLKMHHWSCMDNGKTKYASRISYRHKRRETLLMHVELMKPPAGMQVDHIDGNGLNNQRSNLRLATAQQNMSNRSRPKHNTSGYTGVSRRGKKWQASIMFEKKTEYLGRFDTPEAAALAYNARAQELFGEFARLNVVPSGFLPNSADEKPDIDKS